LLGLAEDSGVCAKDLLELAEESGVCAKVRLQIAKEYVDSAEAPPKQAK